MGREQARVQNSAARFLCVFFASVFAAIHPCPRVAHYISVLFHREAGAKGGGGGRWRRKLTPNLVIVLSDCFNSMRAVL